MALEPLGVEMVVQGLGTYKGQLQQAQAATDKAAGATGKLAHEQQAATGIGAKFASGLGDAAGAAVRMAGQLTLLAIPAITALGIGGVKAAADLGESINKTEVIFGDASSTVIKFTENAATSLGQTQQAALEAAAGIGNILIVSGLTNTAAAGMSTSLVQLATDMASLNNEDPSDMLERLRSGLVGQSEPLRKFGVLLSESRVEQEALNSGLVKNASELTDAIKVQARYNLIMKDASSQQGDFARTIDSVPNALRVLKSVVVEASVGIGQELMPTVQALIPALAEGIPKAINAARPFVGALVKAVVELGGGFVEGGKVAIGAMQGIASFLMQNQPAMIAAIVALGAAAAFVFGPVGVIVAAIAATIAALGFLKQAHDRAGDAMEEFARSADESWSRAREVGAAASAQTVRNINEQINSLRFLATQLNTTGLNTIQNAALLKQYGLAADATTADVFALIAMLTAKQAALAGTSIEVGILENELKVLLPTLEDYADDIDVAGSATLDFSDDAEAARVTVEGLKRELEAMTQPVEAVEKALNDVGLEADQVETILAILRTRGALPAADAMATLRLQLQLAGLEGPALDAAMRLAASGMAVLEAAANRAVLAVGKIGRAVTRGKFGGTTKVGVTTGTGWGNTSGVSGGADTGGSGGKSPAEEAADAVERMAEALQRQVISAEKIVHADTRIAEKERQIAASRAGSQATVDAIQKRLNEAVEATTEIERLERAIADARTDMLEGPEAKSLQGSELELRLLQEQINREEFQVRNHFRAQIASAKNEKEETKLIDLQAKTLEEIGTTHQNEIGFLQEQVELRRDQFEQNARGDIQQINALETQLEKAQELHRAKVEAIQIEFDAAKVSHDALIDQMDAELDALQTHIDAEEAAAEAVNARKELEQAIADILAIEGGILDANTQKAITYARELATALGRQAQIRAPSSTPPGARAAGISDADYARMIAYATRPSFAEGGRVSGAMGSPVAAVVHAGEVVLNRAQQSGVLHAAAGLAAMVARLASPGTRMSAPASPVSSSRFVPVPVTLREGPSVHVNASYQQVQSPTSISQDVSFILMRAGL